MEKTLTTTYQPVQHAPIECPYCGAFFSPKNKRRKYCYDAACHREHRRLQMRDYVERYKAEHGHTPTQKYRPAGTPRTQYPVLCAWCGTLALITKKSGRFCSHTCADSGKNAKGTDIILWRRPRVHIPEHTTGTGFTAGKCKECGDYFVDRYQGRLYCSKRCKNRATRDRSMIWDSDWISRTDRIAIYERDDYVCHICSTPTDPESDPLSNAYPSLDHIIPTSLGGDHSPENLKTSHRWCNSIRGNRGIEEARTRIGVTA